MKTSWNENSVSKHRIAEIVIGAFWDKITEGKLEHVETIDTVEATINQLIAHGGSRVNAIQDMCMVYVHFENESYLLIKILINW